MTGTLKWMFLITIVTLTANSAMKYSPTDRLTGMNPCISKQTCHDCIQTPSCAWCSKIVSKLLNYCVSKFYL